MSIDTLDTDWMRETADALRQVADTLTSMKPAQMGSTHGGKPDTPNLRLAFADRAPLDELIDEEGWDATDTATTYTAYIKIGPLFVWATAPNGMVATCERCGTTHECTHDGGER